MEGAIYLLCAATALACAILLFRGYSRTRTRLLLWCGLFFAAMTIENVILFVDLIVVPEVNLKVYWRTSALLGGLILVYGLVWESH